MNFRKLQLVVLVLILPLLGFAQGTLNGVVKDDQGQPLPGANVVVKGTTIGTVTDFDGNFSLSVGTLPLTLEFSSLGYSKKALEVTSYNQKIEVSLETGVALDEVVIVGSRSKNRVATDTPVPVDVIDVSELKSAGPQVSVTQILNYVAPSFSSNTQTVSDGTDHIDPAQLRGLGPDQVLVLVNGKRRHTTSLVNVNGTPGRGSVGTDLNAIPSASIKRIEVLRDGAAAQYGSDAIAGVINIVLNDKVNVLTASVTGGGNFTDKANNHTGGSDGGKMQIDLNYGLPLGKNGGHINFTGSVTTRERTSRAKDRNDQIYHGFNAVEWGAYQDGADLIALKTNVDAVKNYAAMVPYFDATLKANIANATTITDLQTLLNIDVTDQELERRGLTRGDFNMSVGQSALEQGQFMGNMELPLTEEDADVSAKLYAFGGLSYRHGEASGFYRTPGHSSGRGNTPANINGFLPNIESDIADKSLGFGIQGAIAGWDLDLSHVWGKNTFDYNITNTSNFYLQASSPSEFYAGQNGFQQNTVNFDAAKYFENTFEGLNVAFGMEYRVDNYFIQAGEESSYSKYDVNGEIVTSQTLEADQVVDFFGKQASIGSQVFSGFTPENEINAKRNSYALYMDLEADFTENFLLSGALRYERFSDFGKTLNWKLASRLKLNDNMRIRAAVSTGFRAPSLHQQYYSKSNTLFDDNGIASEVGSFTNNSEIAELFGIPRLKEETSLNASLGFTAEIPDANLTFTIDGYFIQIDDRITYTGNFAPFSNPAGADQTRINNIFSSLGVGKAAFFANALDTETKGIDLVITHKGTIGSGKITNSLAATYSRTYKIGETKGSDLLRNAGLINTYFDEASRVYLEEAIPRVKANLTHSLSFDKWDIFLRNAYFGSVFDTGSLRDGSGNVITDSNGNVQHPEIDAVLVTDLTFGYNINERFKLTVGANNLFDIYPDELPTYLTSSNQFVFSRRVSQFGNNGRFLFARLNLTLK